MANDVPIRCRRFTFFMFYLACAFAGGILVERAPRYLAPSHYPPASTEQTFAPFWEAWNLIEAHFVNRAAVKPEHMTQGAIRGLVYSLGDLGHTNYLTAQEMENLRQQLEGRMEGI